MSKDLRNTLLAAIAFIALTCAIGYVDYNVNEELEQVNAANATLDQQIAQLQQEANPKVKEQLEKQLSELQINFKDYVKILPSEDVATEENLLRTVQKYVNDAQITLDSYSMRRVISRADFEEIGVGINGAATFEQLVNFLNFLERHENFLCVNTFSCNVMGAKVVNMLQAPKDVIPMQVVIDISTFRYLPKKK